MQKLRRHVADMRRLLWSDRTRRNDRQLIVSTGRAGFKNERLPSFMMEQFKNDSRIMQSNRIHTILKSW